MSDVTGPISSLPGSWHPIEKGATCDNHPDREATRRLQGETDSFGSEMHDLCDECATEYRNSLKQPVSQQCDWCKQKSTDCAPMRDIDEGLYGPVYTVCRSCRISYNTALDEEM